MSAILFCIPPALGAMNSTLKLARRLAGRGHDVWYAGIPDCEAYVRAHGFRFMPLFGEWFPQGYVAAAWTAPQGGMVERYRVLRARATSARRFIRFLQAGGRDQFREAVAHIRPRLCIIGPEYFESAIWGLLAHYAGIQTIYLNSSFACPEHDSAPPVQTGLTPDGTFQSRVRIGAAWKLRLLRKRLYERLSSGFGCGLDWWREFESVARSCGYPSHRLNMRDLVAPRLEIPELVLWPREFDFPNAEHPGRIYIEPSILADREEPAFPWERVDAGRKLIYCALGSLRVRDESWYCHFFSSVLSAVGQRGEWQLVLATGSTCSPDRLPAVPGNAIIVDRAPQLALLARAHIAITHGGANSVKECLWFGVPSVVFPFGFDPPGISARLVYHGAGLAGDVRKVDASRLLSLLDKVDSNPAYRVSAERLRERLENAEREGSGVHVIEQLIS